jgi:hypothetical protein
MDATCHLVASSEIFLVLRNKHVSNFGGYPHNHDFHMGISIITALDMHL